MVTRTNAGTRLTRRRFLSLGLAALTTAIAACTTGSGERNRSLSKDGQQPGARSTAAVEGRLLVRPAQPERAGMSGLRRLELDQKRDGLLYVPAGYRTDQPAPLVVMLHGAGSNADRGLRLLRDHADAVGTILLAPESRGRTWDIIIGDYGPDITFMDQALAQVFASYAVDSARLAIGGFSDGASYALSVGLMNGDLFSHIIAFSPGFMAPLEQQGAPRIFISHGTMDEVLPIDRCSRRIVSGLQRAGYDIQYHEFDGPHTIPPDISQAAVDWFVGVQN